MVKQFLKSTGDRGVPQGSPLSPLLANLALNDLDHALDRGGDTITYTDTWTTVRHEGAERGRDGHLDAAVLCKK